jgi:hypothetical protein
LERAEFLVCLGSSEVTLILIFFCGTLYVLYRVSARKF